MSNARRWVILCLILMIMVFLTQVLLYALHLNPWHVPFREMVRRQDVQAGYFFNFGPAFLSLPVFGIVVLWDRAVGRVGVDLDNIRNGMKSVPRLFQPPNLGRINPAVFICLIATMFTAFSILMLYISLTGNMLDANNL